MGSKQGVARRTNDTKDRPLRQYERIWNLIVTSTSDAPVKVRCPVGNHKRLIKAVRKEKALANVLRKSLNDVAYGRLIVVADGEVLKFSLVYNGDMI